MVALCALGHAVTGEVLRQPHSTDRVYEFPTYSISISHADGLGIRTFRLAGQQTHFPHIHHPVGDWEWFSLKVPPYGPPHAQAEFSEKLVGVPWMAPEVREKNDRIVLVYRREDVVHPGIDLTVRMELERWQPRVAIAYQVDNGSGQTLLDPYLMIGLPGFLRHLWVSAVETGTGERREAVPAGSAFAMEAANSGRSEYTLLRDEVWPAHGDVRPLRGIAEIVEGKTRFRLVSTFVPDRTVRRVLSAHVNKPTYLTSHLYLFLTHMDIGETRTITVTHELSYTGEPPTRIQSSGWGGIKAGW